MNHFVRYRDGFISAYINQNKRAAPHVLTIVAVKVVFTYGYTKMLGASIQTHYIRRKPEPAKNYL